ncbi:Unannotated [Lentimonas sp. CC10]|nr:Unannotated [Lentimonas sp. CC10]
MSRIREAVSICAVTEVDVPKWLRQSATDEEGVLCFDSVF